MTRRGRDETEEDLPDGWNLEDPEAFSRRHFPGHALRDYQIEPARAILDSILNQRGEQHAVAFSRQSGKDEMLAQLVAQVLSLHRHSGGSVALVAPTFRPQAATMRDRLVARLRDARFEARTRDQYIVEVGEASARFLSASPLSKMRGQTASLLLVANEAQDIEPEIWDTVFDPMAAATNATTLFMGTVWSRHTLLARQMRFLTEVEQAEKARRVWKVDWEQVSRHLTPYGDRVRERIAHLGRDHPAIRTEYFLEELDDAGALFTEQRLAQMQGDHPRRHSGEQGKRYALLIDVAGESEQPVMPGMLESGAGRDSTALTVVEIGEPPKDLGWSDLPAYRVVDRMLWTGISHVALHAQIVDLAWNVWKAAAVIVDATGIGAGLASFLQARLSRREKGRRPIQVVPFVFTSASKSRLGWDFVALIDTGRYKEYEETADPGSSEAAVTRAFWAQMRSVEYEVATGPGHVMRWAVPAGRGHDDLVMSAALTAALDGYDLRPRVARGRF
jgi:hypothetical protein